MIVPLLRENAWLPRIEVLPAWLPDDWPMVVIAPHPDDETLAAGGLIASQRARGVDVTVVAVTDGEHAYEQNHGLGEVRRLEQEQALAKLGVPKEKIVRLELTDSGVAQQEAELTARIRPLVTSRSQVVAPWVGDFHPDHEACARAAGSVSRLTGAKLISYLFWTWHRGTIATVAGLALKRFHFSSQTLQAKTEALACHVSQLKHAPEPEILPEDLLWPARMPYEVFAV